MKSILETFIKYIEAMNLLRYRVLVAFHLAFFHALGYFSGRYSLYSKWQQFQSQLPSGIQSLFSIEDFWVVSFVSGLGAYLFILALKFYNLEKNIPHLNVIFESLWMTKVTSFFSQTPIWCLLGLASYFSGLTLNAVLDFGWKGSVFWIASIPIFYLAWAMKNTVLDDKEKLLPIARRNHKALAHVFSSGSLVCLIFASISWIDQIVVKLGGYLLNQMI